MADTDYSAASRRVHGLRQATGFKIQQQRVILRDLAGMHGVHTHRVHPSERFAYILLSIEDRRKDMPVVTLAHHLNIVGEVCIGDQGIFSSPTLLRFLLLLFPLAVHSVWQLVFRPVGTVACCHPFIDETPQLRFQPSNPDIRHGGTAFLFVVQRRSIQINQQQLVPTQIGDI